MAYGNRTYSIPPKNARAVCQIRTWLTATGIQHRPSTTPGSDITIVKSDGQELEVSVTSDPTTTPKDAVVVLAQIVTNRKIQKALDAFHEITVAAGYGKPEPISRGPVPTKKLNFHTDFELVSMRHCEFRRVPNPSKADLTHYKGVIERTAWAFLRSNYDLCAGHGLEIGDLVTYAQVWTCNYLGLYVVPSPTNNDNEKKLHYHLMQRFSNFRDLLYQKGKGIFVTPEDASIASGREEEIDATPDTAALAFGVDADVDEVYRARHCQIDTTSEDNRRRSAATLLDQHLDKLTHEQKVAALSQVVESQFVNYDAKREAARRLRLLTAPADGVAAVGGVDELFDDVDVADPGSVSEQL